MILLSVIAVLWVIVAVWFFYTGIREERRIKRIRASTHDPDSITNIGKDTFISQQDIDWKKRFKEAKWNMLVFFVISGILAMHGFIILFNLERVQSQIISMLFLILSLIWLIGSSFFYYISLRKDIRLEKKKYPKKIKKDKWSFTDSEISVVLFAVVATILASNGLAIGLAMSHDYVEEIGRIILIVAVLWLYGGFIFLYRALRANVRLKLYIDKQVKGMDAKLATEPDLEYKIEESVMVYERGVIWFAAIAIVLALNAIIMNFSKDLKELYGTLIAHIFEIVALVWLLGAVFFLFMVLRSSKVAAKLREEQGVKEGKIEYVDALDEGSEMLFSKKYGLRGRPDYILERNGDLVPVEVKTGRIPRGPLFSHIMQVVAYCLLIEDTYNRSPPYGIIRYGDVQHRIDYTDEVKNILLSKLDEMRKIIASGEAHRNHKRPSKCKGCSRREMCPDKLV